MKIVFTPNELDMWQDTFSFRRSVALVPTIRPLHKEFANRNELIEFLKEYGVILTDTTHPLTISSPSIHPEYGWYMSSVTQDSTLFGWIKEF